MRYQAALRSEPAGTYKADANVTTENNVIDIIQNIRSDIPMGRQLEFDRVSALDQAVLLFWRRGYDGVGIDDVVLASGASRYGLYAVFGDKRELFLAAIERYANAYLAPLLGPLAAEGADLGSIRRYFEALAKLADAPLGEWGCLLCNSMVDKSAKTITGKFAKQFRDRLDGLFAHAVKNAISRSQIPANHDAIAMARRLRTLAIAISLGAASGESGDNLGIIAESTLAAL